MTTAQAGGARRWEFWIDRGGTFTDCLGRNPESGEIHVAKLLSSDRAPIDGIRRILGLHADEPIPPADVRMGTTIATNALLERKGAPALLVVTHGFGDLLEIGTQARPELFEIAIRKPERLYRAVLEVDARSDPSGRVLRRPDGARLFDELRAHRESGLSSAAVVLIHAYADGALETELAEHAARAGFEHVAVSHEIADELGLLARGDTAMLDAYLTPLIRDYVQKLLAELSGSTLRIMQSSGDLVEARRFRGPHAILSGPAGGVVATARVAERAGVARAIGFDMGGTSTDVSRWDGEFERRYETEIGGVRVRAPMLAIHTVAAGGGSLCRFDGQRLSVGPDSAGADPGPLCYGNSKATELTITDCNLLLGRLASDRFPFPLDVGRPRAALDELATRLKTHGYSPEQVADGFLRIANLNMAEAIRRVSVARGYDVRDYALVVFGGAGGQHATQIAQLLGIRTVLFHPLAGVLSALGMGVADVGWHGAADAGRHELSDDALVTTLELVKRLSNEGRAALVSEGFTPERIEIRPRIDLRYRGTETALTLPFEGGSSELSDAFSVEHARRFGYARPDHTIELVAARVEAVGRRVHEDMKLAVRGRTIGSALEPLRRTRLFVDGRFDDHVPVYLREDLGAGQRIAGPLMILEATSTIVLDPGFELEVAGDGLLVARDVATSAPAVIAPERGLRTRDARADPVLLEIMANSYMSIAEQMGHVLRRTALSTNIRERLDFSCAVFDKKGSLVANAPHIPVHLGAMGESVRGVVAAHPELAPGDVFVTNDPAAGGSHLPDITVVTPMHDAEGRLVFFLASRGHHADVGGTTPGSMPSFSETLEQEGVVLRALRIVRASRLDRELVLDTLGRGPYPARDPQSNLADLEAQIAANRTGVGLLEKLVARYGLDLIERYMQHVQDDAAAKVAAEIARLPDGHHRFADALDDGTPVVVTLSVEGERMIVDFSGTGPEHASNLNAPRAVSMAAVIYFLRTLVGAPIPLNDGCLRPVEIRIPPGSLLAPGPLRAVAGGNVETSQRIVDVLLAAAGRAAASQGTMNNLTFGDETFGYYETIAGGAGAGPGFDGASAVHTHMTNTRITDPEVLESRFPVRLLEFSVRRGSGGSGQYRGGDGVVRALEFLRPVHVAILSERRTRAPFGLAGGQPGLSGKNTLDGRDLGGKCSLDVPAGARLRIETPGGGGFGPDP